MIPDNANAFINNNFLFFLGIALENQPRVFNEFAQFNRNTLQGGGGSGLGLWICRNLATLHGGEMVIISSTGMILSISGIQMIVLVFDFL